ncbi:MAG: autotransporter domain-containing protein [Lysobacteraceae bacterium]|nr:MAG: autotransporter domain-containing protein [Xanthomonadaceae bacterium]
MNAGTIIGNVQLDPNAYNQVTLVAGGRIVGDLSIGNGQLMLDGESGTSERYSQAVTGATTYAGGVTKKGEGTWILDTPLALGKDLYADYPSADIFAGTLQIGNGGAEGPNKLKAVHAYGTGRLVFNRSDDFLFDGSIDGDGSLVQAGSGLLTLDMGGVFTGQLVIAHGARLKLLQGWVPRIANDGELTFENQADTYWSGDISGTGSIIHAGGWHLTLAGKNTYTGATIVNSGSLELRQGLAGDLRINPTGEFGAGTADLENYVPRVGGDLYNAGKFVITQGDPIIWSIYRGVAGDFFVGGDYVQARTGTFSVTLGDKLDITGAARLEGGTLEVRGAAVGYVANTHTDVLTAAGGVTGTFDRLVKGAGVVFTSSTIHYGANSVWLDTTGLDVTLAASGNGIGYTPVSMASAERVQGAFERINGMLAAGAPAGASDAFLEAAGRFQRAPTIAAAQASLRSLSGQMYASSAGMTFRTIDAGDRMVSARLDALRAGSSIAGAWTRQVGAGGGIARGGFDGVGFQHAGWLVGSDRRIGDTGVAGFALSRDVGIQQLAAGFDQELGHSFEGMLYGGVTQGSWFAQGRLGLGSYRRDATRLLLLGEAADGVWTRYGGRYRMAYGESGLRLGRGPVRFEPFLGVQYARNQREGFAEQGAGGFGLRTDAHAVDRWRADVGMRATRRWQFGRDRSVDLSAYARRWRTLASTGDAMDASFVGLEQWMPLEGIGLSRFGTALGLGMGAKLSRRASLDFAYEYENDQYENAQALSARLNFAW